MVEVLNPAVFDNIHAKLHKLFDVVAERARVGGDVIFFQIGKYMINFRYLVDIALIDKENCETLCAANCETLCAANCSLCGARSCVGKMVPEPYGG